MRKLIRGEYLDNKYTRKEEKCPLCVGYCDKGDKDCNKCIAEEEEWQCENGLKGE